MNMILIILTIVISVFACTFVFIKAGKNKISSVRKFKNKPYNFDMKKYKDEIKVKGYEDSFVRPRDIFNAVSKRTKRIIFIDNKATISAEDISSSFEQFASKSLYSVIVDYTLIHELSSFVSLDEDIHSNSIQFMNQNSLEHCHNGQNELMIGNILIASEKKGMDENIKVLNPFQKYLRSESLRKNKSFLVLRKITNIIGLGKGTCVRYETEDLHPLELIESFVMKSNISHPFNTNFYPYDKFENARVLNKYKESKMESQSIPTPDSPLKACSDSSWSDFNFFAGLKTDGSTYASKLSITYACAEYANSFPGSFNYNYDRTSQSAKVPDMTISNGIICHNCYLYLGTYYYVHVEFSVKNGIGMEVILSGEAGANADIKLTNPSISAYIEITLIDNSKSSYVTLPIGSTGITLGIKFDSLKVGLSGSGSATGTANLIGGSSASASATAIYSGSKKGFYSQYSTRTITPSFNSNNLQVTSFMAQVDLNFYTSFQVGLLSGVIAANFEIQSKVFVSYKYSNTLSYASVIVSGVTNSRRLLLNQNTSQVFKQGQTLKIIVMYKNFAVNENTTVFYSLISSNNNEDIPILIKNFITSSTGEGVFEAEWLVPWDENLINLAENKLNQDYKIQIHCSNLIEQKIQSKNSIKLDLYSDFDSIFISPANNQIIPIDRYYKIQWQKNLLKYYDVYDAISGYGVEKRCEHVFLCIVAETLNSQDSTVNSSKKISLTDSSKFLNNTGYYQVNFPLNVTKEGSRFYFQVECMERPNIFGWSSGYFYFVDEETNLAVPRKTALSNIQNDNRHLLISRIENNDQTDQSSLSSLSNDRVELTALTCTSQYPALLTMGLQMSFKLSSIKILILFELKVGLQLGSPVTLLSKSLCVRGSISSPTKLPISPTRNPINPTNKPIQPTVKPASATDPTGRPIYQPTVKPNIPTVAPSNEPTVSNCVVSSSSYIGDGYCDMSGVYNTASCNFDGGDCCSQTCTSGKQYTCGQNGYLCLNPVVSNKCEATYLNFLGDGWCDDISGAYNTAECNYDMGDCCVESCTFGGSYSCGSNGYTCKNPKYQKPPTIEPSVKPYVEETKKPISTSCTPPNPTWIGDGWCDTEIGYNVESCSYDGGDCCASTCVSTAYNLCGSNGYNCINPSYQSACLVTYRQNLGDGFCDSPEYNNYACNYDNGDCCSQTCVSGNFTCGIYGYDCRNPTYIQTTPSSVFYYCGLSEDCVYQCSQEILTYQELYSICLKLDYTCDIGYCSFTTNTSQPSLFPTTFTPTLIQSTFPSKNPTSNIPSYVPSYSPSLIPTIYPSFKQTAYPTFTPTESPSNPSTYIPSISVLSTSPSFKVPVLIVQPQSIPTTEVPTYMPTPLPKPVASFVTTLTVQGLALGCATMDDNKTQGSFLSSQAKIMNISETSLSYQGCSMKRRLLGENSNIKMNIQSAYDLSTSVKLTLNSVDNIDFNVNNAATKLFDTLSSTLSQAVVTGNFFQVLQSIASVKYGIDTTSLSISSSSTSGLAVTIYTYKPTVSPSQKPSNPYDQLQQPSSSSSSSQLSMGAIIGIGVGGFVLATIIGSCLYYYFNMKRLTEPVIRSDSNLDYQDIYRQPSTVVIAHTSITSSTLRKSNDVEN